MKLERTRCPGCSVDAELAHIVMCVQRRLLARCPGCGDRGDLAHVIACTRARLQTAEERGWRNAVAIIIGAMTVQIRRRGKVRMAGIAKCAQNFRSSGWRWDR